MSTVEMKPSNPKDLIGSDKLPLHLWPETATALGCLACLDGNLKYGRTNWRAAGVKASIYFDALKRHVNAWFDEGEDLDPDSGLPHLAHALACLAIIVDAQAAGKLTDDRLIQGGYRKLVDDLTPHVAKLKAKHADKHPRHYTIADSGEFSVEPVAQIKVEEEGVARYGEGLNSVEDVYYRDRIRACNDHGTYYVCTLPKAHVGPHTATDVSADDDDRSWE